MYRLRPRVAWLLSALFACNVADAASFRVGSGGGRCTHASLQAALDAAASVAGPHLIRVTQSLTYTQQALTLQTSQEITIEGGAGDCFSLLENPAARTTIDGAGGSQAPVFTIETGPGGVVRLSRLVIRGGDAPNGKGGGIYFKGAGMLGVSEMAITNNVAADGGGMYLEGTDTGATVFIGGNVTILSNRARFDGGGVFAEAVNLQMVQPGSIIAFNVAEGVTVLGFTSGGRGGGLVVDATEHLDGHATIGSTGVGTAGAIHNNEARYGGGAAVLAESNSLHDATLHLHATAAGEPATIDGNFASVAGGAVYLGGDSNSLASGVARLWYAVLDDNAAPQGAAIYADPGSDALVLVNQFAPDGAAPCPTSGPCGGILGNVDLDEFGQRTEGAVVAGGDALLYFGERFSAQRPATETRGFLFEGNRGGALFQLTDSFLGVKDALVTDNAVSQRLFDLQDGSGLRLADTTVAGNTIGAAAVIGMAGDIELARSIVWQPGKNLLDQSSGLREVAHVVANEAASAGGGPGAIVADPRFIDPALGNYRLRAASPAVDYAPAFAGDDRDADGLPRDADLSPKPNVYGVRDVGAFERRDLSPLVLNRHFDEGLTHWPGGNTSFTTAEDNGGTIPGSAKVALSNFVGTRVFGAAQCVHLPGPSAYALSGSAKTAGTGDAALLHWEYRRDGGEACTAGAPTRSGEFELGSGAQWTSASATIPAGEWTSNSSVTVHLVMEDRDGATPPSVTGWFDDIALSPTVSPNALFSNGFEEP